ncbi:hypothetical protein GCM10011531_11170 [Aquaticitalea lipolytica]|uniref:Uncharacterized protein n=1 Tax=Aquaticitalea lipolytica TaxID=1247562 RepID=A0A8J2TTS7_9FLAO|nr:hypothetical protein GCM10011531_11170 [Aquaticitalea lipolytica]
MRYIIITLVIAAILALLSYFLDFVNNKSDKVFLITISIILILTGLFFSVKSEILKDSDEKFKVKKIDTTLNNTITLKKKADSIIENLNESLEKTIKIKKNIDSQNKKLGDIEKDVKLQIKTLNSTLKQTEIFQKMVDEQNKRDIAQFERDAAKIEIFSGDIKLINLPENNDKYKLKFYLRNSGKRKATNVKINSNLLFYKNGKFAFVYEPDSLMIDFNDILGSDFNSNNNFPYLESVYPYNIREFDSAFLIIKLIYEDESFKKPIKENFLFICPEIEKNSLKFYNLTDNQISNLTEYINNSNFSFLLSN